MARKNGRSLTELGLENTVLLNLDVFHGKYVYDVKLPAHGAGLAGALPVTRFCFHFQAVSLHHIKI